MHNQTVYDYIQSEMTKFKTKQITLGDNWRWNMYEHINRSFLMKHSKFFTGSNELGKRPNKNIIKPILNVSYRSEGFNVTEIEPYVDNPDNYHKSLVMRKFHPSWALRNGMDTFIDEVVESYVDYGGALVKSVAGIRPEVVPMQRIAFCDQRDMLSGPMCEKHDYSVSQLLDMGKVWYAEAIDEAIVMFRAQKDSNKDDMEVFELHVIGPESWLDPEASPKKYCKQLHIVTYYKGEDDKMNGITLFKSKEYKDVYKTIVRDGIYNRALGWGGVEELFEPQIWTNYDIIQIKEMLDVASLMILQTQDPAFGSRNKITDKKKGEIVTTAENSPITQVRIEPINMQQFRNSIVEWEQSARTTGSAQDAQLGINPVSGTPLGTTQLVTGQGQGIHEYRQGKISTFIAEVYRDWVLEFVVKDMNQGAKFLEELSFDELRTVGENVVNNYVNKTVKGKILNGGILTQEQVDAFKELELQKFMKGGNKRFMELLKGELKGLPISVRVNIAGKQKNLASDVTKLSNIFREIIVNPQGFMQAMQIPAIASTFNEILEFSGLNQINFGELPKMAPVAPAQAGGMAGVELTAK